MSETVCAPQLNLFSLGQKQVTVDFKGENIVSDAGLLPIAQLIDGLTRIIHEDVRIRRNSFDG